MSNNLLNEIKSTLKGYGEAVSAGIKAAESATSETAALAAEKLITRNYHRGQELASRKESLMMAGDWLSGKIGAFTSKDHRKCANLVDTIRTGRIIGSEVAEVLPHYLKAYDGEGYVSRALLAKHGLYSNNNKRTFSIMLEKLGATKQDKPGSRIEGYFLIKSCPIWQPLKYAFDNK